MRTRLIAVLLAFCVSVGVYGQQAWSYQKTVAEVTVSGTAGAVFTASDINAGSGHVAATQATCSLLAANIRVTWDGTTATTSYGQVLTPGQYIISGQQTLLNLNAVRDDSTSATLNCVVYGQ